MIRCPQCGTDNLDGSEYCDECGYQLSALRGAPMSGVTPQVGGPAASSRSVPPVATPSPEPAPYGSVPRMGVPDSRELPPGLAAADFSPPPPNIPSVAIPPHPHPAVPAPPPSTDVFTVAPPAFSGAAGIPAAVTPPSPPPSVAPPPVAQSFPSAPAVPPASSAQKTSEAQIPSPPPATPVAAPAPPPAAPHVPRGAVPRAKLVIQRGGTIGKEFLLTETESNIGRWDADGGIFPDVDLDQDDPEAKVSRRHARIVCQDGQYILEDLGSTNGTFVNRGRRLLPGNRHPLNDGDEIIVGKTFLKFHYIR